MSREHPEVLTAGELVEQRAVAEAAARRSRGRWRVAEQPHGEWFSIQDEHFVVGTVYIRQVARFVGMFSPEAVLCLLDALEAERARAERWERLAVETQAEISQLMGKQAVR